MRVRRLMLRGGQTPYKPLHTQQGCVAGTQIVVTLRAGRAGMRLGDPLIKQLS